MPSPRSAKRLSRLRLLGPASLIVIAIGCAGSTVLQTQNENNLHRFRWTGERHLGDMPFPCRDGSTNILHVSFVAVDRARWEADFFEGRECPSLFRGVAPWPPYEQNSEAITGRNGFDRAWFIKLQWAW